MTPADLGLVGDEAVAVFLIDVDRFKAVNDVLGYRAGDRMLKVIEQRIRAWSGPRAEVARVADDEFGVIRPGLIDLTHAIAEGERLRIMLAEPVDLGEHTASRQVSIGFAYGHPSTATTIELLRRADDAMEIAQQTSGNVVRVFEERLRTEALARSVIELQLRDAVVAGELTMYFQPEIDLRSGAVVAVEALIRWPHPVLGLLGADRFIDVAEQTGIIGELGEWALRRACRQWSRWRHEYVDLPLMLRVNMSPTQVADGRTPALIADALREHGVPPDRLCIEVTELVPPPDRALAIEVLRKVRSTGVEVAIDDFGAGHSSLSRLRSMPVDAIKIDRQFVAELGTNATDTIFVEGIARFASALNLDLIAEGVQSPTAIAELLRIGCTRAQGNWFAPAVRPEELAPLLAAGRVPADRLVANGDSR